MSSLDALVAETGRALNAARRLFGSAPAEGSLPSALHLATGRQGVAEVGEAASAGWRGRAAGAYVATNADQLEAFDSTLAADGRVSPALTDAGRSSAEGARNMDTLIAQTRAGVAALAASTRSAAGQQQLASYLQGQVSQAKGLLQNFQQRGGEIASTIQGADYRDGSGHVKDSPPAAPLDSQKWKPGDKHHIPYSAGKGGLGPPNLPDSPPWVDVYDRTKDPDQVPHYFVRSDEIPDYKMLSPGSLGPSTVYDQHGNPDPYIELAPNSGVWVPKSAFPGAKIYPPGSGALPPYGWEEYLPGSGIYVWHGDLTPEPYRPFGPLGPPTVPQGGH
ncbi:nitrate- and nitrite sensing domain-containing protein [Mycobacterium intracellulare]|uniref:nitrate- and nitrite sensing domain-containing protein n=1 Tax=Mycobacterium intracellulare TaxID=1767 RepID=UPI001CDA4449|nr:nitrate- and nitrite sensing domain-containing protein [Mycobacterium intracellulare]MCA2304810.1 nitrate- and nitrite sensing domain-containing protein [Mycobacterium intracellulare]MCA2347159.1 nitrate- and nitrite sensing domain-containing protein [Mycobacterium intracellulare]